MQIPFAPTTANLQKVSTISFNSFSSALSCICSCKGFSFIHPSPFSQHSSR